MGSSPVVELNGLGRRFGERAALEGVTLTVPAGATVAVLGPNGAGKSTLLRILAGLLRPTEGVAQVLGSKLPDEGWAVRGRVGFLAHEPMLYRELTARENLAFHAGLFGVARERVDEVLDAVGLGARAGDRVAELSRGMTQRVSVARAVLHDPEVLLLDEPVANLDPGAAAQVAPLIGAASGRTRILTSHDPDAAVAEADLVLALRDGRAVYAGAAADVDLAGLYA
ncbi:ABC transporter ATP-binding protein [Svornostia abyssi]|uniref:ABC transporter ATP-binding protein n=1 Tax=Svornostia abyssi TaxID=2898438 RepID=A0ABY5PJE2_9ACTN|nr:ABC transporter ATP-binding protein [Parviterribacteraceae bacterium J379]